MDIVHLITGRAISNVGRVGAVYLWEDKDDRLNEIITEVFLEQPLNSPGSANYQDVLVQPRVHRVDCSFRDRSPSFICTIYSLISTVTYSLLSTVLCCTVTEQLQYSALHCTISLIQCSAQIFQMLILTFKKTAYLAINTKEFLNEVGFLLLRVQSGANAQPRHL